MNKDYILELSKSEDKTAMVDIVNYVTDLIFANAFTEIDEALGHIVPDESTTMALLVWLRTSIRAATQLKNWAPLRDKTYRIVLAQRGEKETLRIMQGLIPEKKPRKV